jgi:ADP-heptose:LPS heptosyltransferase
VEILLVKLGALGDVLRTTPLLTALKSKYPASRITWVVDAPHMDVLKGNPRIDRLLDSSDASLKTIETEQFDLAVNLDKEPEATRFLMAAKAKEKHGFAQTEEGRLCATDALSDYAYRLGIDDELKFRKNQKTYQQISFEQLGMRFEGEEYVLSIPEEAEAQARAHLRNLGLEGMPRPFIGLNTGAGNRFAGKRLPVGTLVDLCDRISEELGGTVLLLGGKDEIARNAEIQSRSKHALVNTGAHPIIRFAAIVRACDAVIAGDTTAMHIAIAVKTPVVAYFGSTCAQEIEMYGRGRKVVSPLDCAPCYKKKCPTVIEEQCMKDIKPSQILRELKELLGHASRLP